MVPLAVHALPFLVSFSTKDCLSEALCPRLRWKKWNFLSIGLNIFIVVQISFNTSVLRSKGVYISYLDHVETNEDKLFSFSNYISLLIGWFGVLSREILHMFHTVKF